MHLRSSYGQGRPAAKVWLVLEKHTHARKTEIPTLGTLAFSITDSSSTLPLKGRAEKFVWVAVDFQF